MVKGLSVKFSSYRESIPRILDIIRLEKELKKHGKIVLKPALKSSLEESTNISFVEEVLKFCLENKNPLAEIFIAEGADGHDTEELFYAQGYRKLAEKYSVGLIDLNTTEVEEIEGPEFTRFRKIKYPKILKESFVISLPRVGDDEEIYFSASLSNMLGAYPSEYYSGFFSSKKNKIRRWGLKYSIYDILKCKMPEFAVLDLSEKGIVFAGQPLEMDKQAAKYLDIDWRDITYLRLIDEGAQPYEE